MPFQSIVKQQGPDSGNKRKECCMQKKTEPDTIQANRAPDENH